MFQLAKEKDLEVDLHIVLVEVSDVYLFWFLALFLL